MLKQKQSRGLRRPAGSRGCKTNKRWWCVCADREYAQMLTLSCCFPLLEHCHSKPCPTRRCFSLRGKEGRLKLQDWRWRRHTLVRVGGDLLDWVSFTSWWPALVSGGASLAAFLPWLLPLRCSCMVVSLVVVMPHTVQVKFSFCFLLLVAAKTLDAAISGLDPTCADYTDVSQSPTFNSHYLTLIRSMLQILGRIQLKIRSTARGIHA
jgi:hypothetical protein